MVAPPNQPVPVFPLPGVVLFPHVELPLHIFELRYRTMVREALSAGRVIALALLEPGWERDYYGSPEFYPLGCLARFEEVEWLPNDCYNLRVLGLSRVRFGRVVKEFPYRAARVSLLPEDPYPEDDPLIQIERRSLVEILGRVTEAASAGTGAAAGLSIPADLPYARLVNTLCTTLNLPPQDKMKLLELDSVVDRGRRVREQAEAMLRVRVKRHPEGGEVN